MADPLRIVVHDVSGHPFQVQLSRKLAERGHEVLHLYFDSFQSPRGNVQRVACDPPTFAIEGLKFDRPFAKYNLIRRRLDEVRYGRMAARRIAEFAPDVLLASNTPIDAQKVIHGDCRRRGLPVVFWLQDVYSIAMRSILRKRSIPFASWIADYYERAESSLLHESHAVVSISPDFQPILDRWGVRRDRCSVVENWAPLDEVRPVEQRNRWSEAHGLGGKFVFLYSGTIGMKHNPGMLVALADAFAGRPEVEVVVISEGLGADWLRGNPRPNLRVLPLQRFQELGNALSSASVLVALLGEDSGAFSVPSKVLTYHCIGRPLLLAVPKSNLAARIVEQNQTGLVVSPDDVSAFVASARRLYDDGMLRESAGRKAAQYAAEKFDISRIADRFEEILGKATMMTA
jgi:colanic acid biosynthesis glycosyl transferase WcaI